MLVKLFQRLSFLFSRLSKLPLLSLSLSFILGVLIGEKAFHNLNFFLLFLFFIVLVFFRRSVLIKIIIFLLIGSFVGFLRINYFNKLYDESWIKENWNSEVEFEGTIIREPSVKGNTVQYILKPDLKSKKNYGFILIKNLRFPMYSYGDRLKVRGVLEEPENFDEFSYKEYLRTQEVIGTMSGVYIKRTGQGGNILLRLLYELKDDVKTKVRRLLPEPHSSLLLGIVLGVKSGMPEEFNNNLSRTGTTHIIAVSGYNVTIIVAAISGFSKSFGRKKVFWLSLIFLFVFLMLVGADNSPALRATIIGFTYLIGKNIGRRSDTMSSLFFVAALMIFINPYVVYSISFQLSFASIVGLVIFSNKIENFITQRLRLTGLELAPTISAILATLPITIGNFQTFSTISLFVNVIVLPAIPLLMLLGFCLIFISFISTFLAKLTSYLSFLLLNFVIEAINFFGELGFSQIYVPNLRMLPLLIYGFLFIVFFESMYKKYLSRYE